MRLSVRQLEELEKDNKNLQQENTTLKREKSTIDKVSNGGCGGGASCHLLRDMMYANCVV